MLHKFIFITPERLTCKPYCDSPLPEFIDMEVITSGQELAIEDALEDILELNEHPEEHRLQETYSLDLRNDSREFFRLQNYNNKIGIAS